jgi:acyl-CoA synthetase (NDP forming)
MMAVASNDRPAPAGAGPRHQGGGADERWFSTLDAVLNPAGIAIIGASKDLGKTGGRILEAVRNSGYQGRVVLVNPRYESVAGYPCVPAVEQIPGPAPDTAYIALPQQAAIEQVRRCGAAGVRGCIVVGTGFAEQNPRGRQLQDELGAAAREAGVRLIGPNCLGVISSRRSLNLEGAITLQEPARPGPVGVISQSGSLMLCIYHGLADAGSGISFGVSVGNQIDVCVAELMRYGAYDPHTHVIAVYAESLGDADQFLRAAALCRDAGTRVIIVKTGGSSSGAEVTASHTAAIVGSQAAFEAACRSVGVLVADDIDIMAEAAAALSHWPVPARDAVAVMSSSGGGAAVLADRLAASGIPVATLSRSTVASLSRALNPIGRQAIIDFGRRQEGKPALDSAELCNVLMSDPAVGAGVFSLTVTPAMTERCEAVASAAKRQGKLIVATMFPGSATDDYIAPLRAGHIPCLPHVDSALRLLHLLRQAYPGSAPGPSARRASVSGAARHTRGRRLSGGWMPMEGVVALLAEFGVPQPPAGFATSAEAAVALAERLGYPVVLKAVIPGVVHKTDAGGVALDLRDAARVRTAWATLTGRTRQLAAGTPARYYLQKMIPSAAELLVAVQNDAQFGPILMVGAGGVLAELIGDVQVRRLPVSRRVARDMLRQLTIWPVLAGYRGAAPADLSAVITAILAISTMGTRLAPQLQEIEINPLIAGPPGTGVAAVDARIRMAGPHE